MEIALLYYAKEKWKLAYSLSIMRFAFNSHQLNGVKTIQGKTRFGGWNEMIFKVFFQPEWFYDSKDGRGNLVASIYTKKKADPSCLTLVKQGKGNTGPLMLRVYVFTVPEEAPFEALMRYNWISQ